MSLRGRRACSLAYAEPFKDSALRHAVRSGSGFDAACQAREPRLHGACILIANWKLHPHASLMGAMVPHVAEGTAPFELVSYARRELRGREHTLNSRVRRVLGQLENLAGLELVPTFAVMSDEEEQDVTEKWESFLGWVMTTRQILRSEGKDAFLADVGRYLVGQRRRLERAISEADSNLAEIERFILDFVFGEGDGELIPRPVGERGPSEAFEF